LLTRSIRDFKSDGDNASMTGEKLLSTSFHSDFEHNSRASLGWMIMLEYRSTAQGKLCGIAQVNRLPQEAVHNLTGRSKIGRYTRFSGRLTTATQVWGW
jgi:hypothetical protein